jgi:hypothetical protein
LLQGVFRIIGSLKENKISYLTNDSYRWFKAEKKQGGEILGRSLKPQPIFLNLQKKNLNNITHFGIKRIY